MEKKIIWKYAIALIALIAGVLLNAFEIGTTKFAGFASLGSWFIYISIVMFVVITLQAITRKGRKVDERVLLIASKANRVVFLAVIIAAFAIMVLDGISRITLPYHIFMSYLVCFVILVYFVSYKIVEKYN